MAYRIVTFEPRYAKTSEFDFSQTRQNLENKGYSGKVYRKDGQTLCYVFTRPNAVLLELVDENHQYVGEFDLHDLILMNSGMKRLSEKQIVSFVKSVNSGIISLIYNGKTFYVE